MGMNRRWWGPIVGATLIAGSVVTGGASSAGAQEAVWDPCAGATVPTTGVTPPSDEDALAEFGPLGAQPSLSITVPTLDVPDDQQPVPQVTAHRVPGGLLLGLRRPGIPGSALVVVNDDGGVRWRTCFERDLWSVDASPDGGPIVVSWRAVDPATYGPDRIELVSAADGTVTSDVTEAVRAVTGGTNRMGAAPGGVFFGPNPEVVADAGSQLARLDLATGVVASRDYPSVGEGREVLALTLEATGTAYLVARVDGGAPVGAALIQGRWTTDLAAIESVIDPLIRSGTVEAPTIERVRPDGSVMWQRQDLTLWSGEGFAYGVTEDTVLAHVCADGDPINCTQHALVALDAMTGATRWQLDDAAVAVEYGDGNAIVAGTDGYRMIDASTGGAVSPTTWPSGTFANECCGIGEYVYTERLGGIVVAVDEAEVRVFYPEAAAPPPVSVTLF